MAEPILANRPAFGGIGQKNLCALRVSVVNIQKSTLQLYSAEYLRGHLNEAYAVSLTSLSIFLLAGWRFQDRSGRIRSILYTDSGQCRPDLLPQTWQGRQAG